MFNKNEKQGVKSSTSSQPYKSLSTLKGPSSSKNKESAPMSSSSQKKEDDLQKENLDQNIDIQNSQENKQTVKKSASTIPKKPLADRMAMKGLKLKTNPVRTNEQEIETLGHHYPSLLKGSAESELMQLREEVKTLQAENRFYSENAKTFEKLANEIRVELRETDELVEKLTGENENYKRILEAQNSNPSQLELQSLQEENEDLMSQLESSQLHNRKLQELIHKLEVAQSAKKEEVTPVKENIKKQDQENSNTQKIIQDLQMKCTVLLDHIEKKEHERKEALSQVEELIKENEEMSEEITYYKDMARTSKKHAEKAIGDVEFYKGLLEKRNS